MSYSSSCEKHKELIFVSVFISFRISVLPVIKRFFFFNLKLVFESFMIVKAGVKGHGIITDIKKRIQQQQKLNMIAV